MELSALGKRPDGAEKMPRREKGKGEMGCGEGGKGGGKRRVNRNGRKVKTRGRGKEQGRLGSQRGEGVKCSVVG